VADVNNALYNSFTSIFGPQAVDNIRIVCVPDTTAGLSGQVIPEGAVSDLARASCRRRNRIQGRSAELQRIQRRGALQSDRDAGQGYPGYRDNENGVYNRKHFTIDCQETGTFLRSALGSAQDARWTDSAQIPRDERTGAFDRAARDTSSWSRKTFARRTLRAADRQRILDRKSDNLDSDPGVRQRASEHALPTIVPDASTETRYDHHPYGRRDGESRQAMRATASVSAQTGALTEAARL